MAGWRLLAALALAGLAAAQAAAAPRAYHAPRTAWGAPDLQGLWTNTSLTRLERPPGVTALTLGDAEAAALERRLAEAAGNPAADPLGQETSEWREEVHFARLDGRLRSSWLLDPEDGRLPYTPAGRATVNAWRASATAPAAGPEARSASDRCLQPGWSGSGPPMLNLSYAANYRIAQTRDEVVVMLENDHEVRRIRLDGVADPGGALWGGASLGRWEGDTLVVETTRFHPGEAYRQPLYYLSPAARVTERFTRISPTEIRYAFTVDDPATYSRPWRGEEQFRATAVRTYEYACHEGNYSMTGILAGARRTEAEAAKAVAGR